MLQQIAEHLAAILVLLKDNGYQIDLDAGTVHETDAAGQPAVVLPEVAAGVALYGVEALRLEYQERARTSTGKERAAILRVLAELPTGHIFIPHTDPEDRAAALESGQYDVDYSGNVARAYAAAGWGSKTVPALDFVMVSDQGGKDRPFNTGKPLPGVNAYALPDGPSITRFWRAAFERAIRYANGTTADVVDFDDYLPRD